MEFSIDGLLKYNSWANSVLTEHLTVANVDNARICEILSHIAAATSNWVARIQGEEQFRDLWEPIAFNVAKTLLKDREEAIESIVPSLLSDRQVVYRTSSGVEHTNSVGEIVLHLVNHNSYHRGQIAEELLQLGIDPPVMDLIAFFRLQ